MSGGYNSSAPKNNLQQALNKTSKEAKSPVDEQQRINYGVISEVNHDTSQVKVRALRSDGKLGEEISKGFLPLLNPLSQIHLLYGLLREGLVVRIFWRGKLEPQNAVIEVIGDEEHNLLTKSPEPNEITIGPFKIFSGGFGI